jgi:hypothetical protein
MFQICNLRALKTYPKRSEVNKTELIFTVDVTEAVERD